MSASSTCPHSDVHFHLNAVSFGDTNIRYLEITGRCKICEAPMRFRGPAGVSPDHPTVSLAGDEASVPFLFGDDEYDGRATGMRVTVREPEDT